MKMRKLKPVENLQSGDIIKFFKSEKGVPVTELCGMKIASIDMYIDDIDFDGFYRPL